MIEYDNLTDDEVLQLALEREQLTDEARLSLDSELARRKLAASDIDAHKIASEEAAEEEQARIPRLSPLGRFSKAPVGLSFLGKRNQMRDSSGKSEKFETTRWVVFFWIPLFPIGTYTVKRRLYRWLGMTFRSDPEILKKHPRDWNQILVTWTKAAAVLLALRLLFLFANSHPALIRKLFS